MKEFIKLFRNVLAPESDWATFIRKIISILVTAGVTATGFSIYYQVYRAPQLGEQPVSTLLAENGDKEDYIRGILETIKQSDSSIRSVWLYSWPDALQIVPVMYVGDSLNPLPGGALVRGDESAIGYWLFGDCVELDRNFVNYACPINGQEDSWGLIVISYEEGRAPTMACHRKIAAAAHRIGLLLYSNVIHIDTITDNKT